MFSRKPNKRKQRKAQRLTRKPGYEERAKMQLALWAEGSSVHNSLDDECCPDFSCCHPQLRASDELRKQYYLADEKGRAELLTHFLEAFANMEELPVQIIGANATRGACQTCGKVAELRPYGAGGAHICFDCGQKDPETERRMGEHMSRGS